MEEVDKLSKVFMTGLPRQDTSPNRQSEYLRHKLENEKLLINNTLEQLSRAEEEKHKKMEEQALTQAEDLKKF